MRPVAADRPERLEKCVEIGTLFAFYGGLLTQKQQDALRLYYEEDLSLGEIAEELNVSRQNVHELITRSVQKLRHYEATLGGAQHAEETAKTLRQALQMLGDVRCATESDQDKLAEAKALIAQAIRRQEGE